MDESLSLENQEAIEELIWTLNASRGEFALVIVRCNYGQLRDRAIVALRERVENVVVWAMPSETTALLERIRECVTDETAAVMVTGLEGARELDELLSSTNRIREEFRSGCPFPVVLWVTDAGLRSLMRSAPDFESWGTTTQLEISIEDLDQWMNARIHEWSTGELSQRLSTQIEWADLEKELIYTEARLRENNVIFSDELTLCWSAILGSVYNEQWKTEQAIASFEIALKLWKDGVWDNGKAKALDELVRSYYKQSLNHRDRSHTIWNNLRKVVDEYLSFYGVHFPDLLPRHIPFCLGDILINLEKWDVLYSLALKSSTIMTANQDNPLSVRPYGYLAEVAVNSRDWEEVLNQANQALSKLELVKNSDDFNKPIPLGSFNPSHLTVRVDEAWYKILIAKAKGNLGKTNESIQLLEEIRLDLRTVRHSLRYLEVLTSLEQLYRSQYQYLKAFETKQEQFVLEQQMSIRAFVGAGWLRPQQMMRLSSGQMGTELTEETIASAIRSSGRSQDIQNLLDRIASTEFKLTILHGASGVGKSSLVEGGLVPALRQKAIGTRDNVPVLIRQYNNWVGAILEALGESIGWIEDVVLEKLRSNEERNLRTVLIFDQFEEFFFVQHDRVARQRFYSFLREAIELSNVKVILSLREDYLHYLLECRSEMSMINDGDVLSRKVLYEIGNFSRVDARSIIEDLTTRSQFTLDPALLDRLVADLAEPLGEVRPIELQIVGAQLQAENIRTLADYPVGGKAELVDRYLMGTIGDCGEGNGELAELVGYLLTDERGTRPLKTRDELVREMGDLKRSPLPEQLDLVLAVLVGSGLVMRLKESPDDRYQLVHDYLAGVIRDRQKPQFDRLAKELDEEKEKRQLAERNLETVNETLIGLQEETKRTEIKLEAANNQVSLRKKQGTGILIGSIAMLTIASVGSFRAFQMQQESQTGTRLERAGVAAIEEFKSDQTKGLLSAMRSVAELKEIGKDGRSIEAYPAVSPLLAMQTGLDQIRETVLKGHQGRVNSVSFSPDGKTIVTSSDDGTARIWDTSGEQLAELEGHQGKVSSVSFSPDGKSLATSGEDGTARIWDTSGKQLAQFRGDQGRFLSVSFSPDGKTLATSGDDHTAHIWDTSGKHLAQLKGHQGRVLSVSFSPNGKTLVTNGEDVTARIWDTSGKQLAQLKGDQGSFNSVSFSPDGKTLATSGTDGTARIWDTSGKQLAQLIGDQRIVLSVSFSPDGKSIATSGSDGTARIWGTSGKQVSQLKSDQGRRNSVSLSPDGKSMANIEEFETVRIWDTSGKQLAQLKGHQGIVWSVSFSPDGKTIATSGPDGARIWNTSGEQLAQLEDDQRNLNSVSFSPDGKTIATSGDDHTAHIWDTSGKQLAQLKGHQGIVWSVSFSPDGKTIATSGEDGTARIWDTSGKQLAQLKGDQGGFNSVSFSPDGKTLATSGTDGTARIWDTLGRQLAQLKGHQGSLRNVSFSPDGETLATIGSDNTVRIWDTSGRQIAQYDGQGYVNSDWTTIATINPSPTNTASQIVILHPLLPRSPSVLLDRACQKLKYYILQSPELKDDRKMCGFEN